MNRFRRLVVLAVWFAVLLGLAAPALAENGRYSYMYDVYTGFKFRDYYDYNSDNASSYVYMANCRATVYAPQNFSSATLELRRKNSWGFDDSLGTNRFFCYGSASGSWGDPTAGTYFYQLKAIYDSNWNDRSCCMGMSADPVNYYW